MKRFKLILSMLGVLFILNVALGIGYNTDAQTIDDPDGTEMKHSQVVGCGGVGFRYWEPGCCEGIGGCTDTCTNEIEIC